MIINEKIRKRGYVSVWRKPRNELGTWVAASPNPRRIQLLVSWSNVVHRASSLSYH